MSDQKSYKDVAMEPEFWQSIREEASLLLDKIMFDNMEIVELQELVTSLMRRCYKVTTSTLFELSGKESDYLGDSGVADMCTEFHKLLTKIALAVGDFSSWNRNHSEPVLQHKFAKNLLLTERKLEESEITVYEEKFRGEATVKANQELPNILLHFCIFCEKIKGFLGSEDCKNAVRKIKSGEFSGAKHGFHM